MSALRKTFAAGQRVEVRRDASAEAWEPAIYAHAEPDMRGWHRVELLSAPRRIDSMTGAECDESNPRGVVVWMCLVPTQRLRVVVEKPAQPREICPGCIEFVVVAREDHTFTDDKGGVWHNKCAAAQLAIHNRLPRKKRKA